MMRRYWFRTLIGLILSYGMLMMLILGFVHIGDAPSAMEKKFQDADKAINWALGFIVGMFAFGIVGMFTQGLQTLAQSGQLEQLCTSPFGLATNFFARTFVGALTNILTSAILVWLIATTFKCDLHAALVPTILLLALTFTNLLGFGFMVGGLVLVFKQTGQLAIMVRMALFALAIAASDKITEWSLPVRIFAHAMPITDASICLKYVIIKGQMLNNEPYSVYGLPSFWILIGSCVFWTFAGLWVFRFMENWSRDKGTLGAY